MRSTRMENAMIAADRLWGKAMAVAPAFVERYLELCEQLLTERPYVRGDVFREYCRDKGLVRPARLHPNVWVSGPRAMEHLGWIEKNGKVEPLAAHNHMPSVTLWRSLLYVRVPPA